MVAGSAGKEPDDMTRLMTAVIATAGLVLAACWMGIGNFVMYRMVNFKI